MFSFFVHAFFSVLMAVALASEARAGILLSDDLDAYDTAKWYEADGWSSPGACEWKRDHISFSSGIMALTLDDTAYGGQDYSCAQYQTLDTYGYGQYRARLKAASGSGIITGFFVYDEANGSDQDEIDIEFLGEDTTRMQVNYFKDGVGGHETLINLGFDASAGYHSYSFVWRATSIEWYVDGALVHAETGTSAALPARPGKIMMNVWNSTDEGWAGVFNYVTPLVARFKSVGFTAEGLMRTIRPAL
jgi:beta-glucanase (GH16 family)